MRRPVPQKIQVLVPHPRNNLLRTNHHPGGIRMVPVKIFAVQEWATPGSVKGVLGFIGSPNLYRRFIFGFSRICAPMPALTRKDVKFFGHEPVMNLWTTSKTLSAPPLSSCTSLWINQSSWKPTLRTSSQPL